MDPSSLPHKLPSSSSLPQLQADTDPPEDPKWITLTCSKVVRRQHFPGQGPVSSDVRAFIFACPLQSWALYLASCYSEAELLCHCEQLIPGTGSPALCSLVHKMPCVCAVGTDTATYIIDALPCYLGHILPTLPVRQNVNNTKSPAPLACLHSTSGLSSDTKIMHALSFNKTRD